MVLGRVELSRHIPYTFIEEVFLVTSTRAALRRYSLARSVAGLALSWLALATASCTSVPRYDRISARYVGCDAKDLKPVEITNHGWYQSWYVDCGGQQYFCRYSKRDINGWNGCHIPDTN